jgi:hypothetical protein
MVEILLLVAKSEQPLGLTLPSAQSIRGPFRNEVTGAYSE